MTYRVIRRRGTVETMAQSSEAAVAVRILRDWSDAFPQQYLVIRDEQGRPLAYRRPQESLLADRLAMQLTALRHAPGQSL